MDRDHADAECLGATPSGITNESCSLGGVGPEAILALVTLMIQPCSSIPLESVSGQQTPFEGFAIVPLAGNEQSLHGIRRDGWMAPTGNSNASNSSRQTRVHRPSISARLNGFWRSAGISSIGLAIT